MAKALPPGYDRHKMPALSPLEQRHARRRSLTRLFWPLEEAIVVAYVFLAAFGAFRPDQILPISMTVAFLGGLWLMHAWIADRD
jgi:hypothetical protein